VSAPGPTTSPVQRGGNVYSAGVTLTTPTPGLVSTTSEHDGSLGPSLPVETLLAVAITFVLGLRYRLSPDVPVGFLAAAAIVPVTITVLRRFRGMSTIFALSVASAAFGLLLTWFAAAHGLADHSRTIVQTARVLGFGLGALAMLWARTVIGTRRIILVYALGFYASLAVYGLMPYEAWKFSLSVPTTLLVLSLPGIYGKPRREAVALIALAAVSGVSDARSASAMMLIAGALVFSQGTPSRRRRTRSAVVLFRLALVAVGGFYLIQAAILGGDLGEDAQLRTEHQIAISGSVLVGGRPELGAATALVRHQPIGYGAGTLVSPSQVLIAKGGMEKLGYDPNNGYVEIYMFGDGIEVHSLLGDLWLLFGIPGMLLAVSTLGFVVLGMIRALGNHVASGALLFLAVRLAWDFAFSPFPSAMDTLMLVVAVALPLVATGARMPTHRRSPGSTGTGAPPSSLAEPL
jgi:hypothetical protein